MTTVRDEHIDFSPYKRQWWYVAPSYSIATPHQFVKECRNHAYVYAVVKMPEEVWLPGDDLENPTSSEGLPSELLAYRDVFAPENAKTLPPQKATDHTIELKDGETPPYGPIYPLSQTELRELRAYLDENLDNGRIRPSKSPAGAPILFVPKKDGSLRLCVDYRGLNKVSVKNRYPLPLISEILDRLAGAKFFSKIDIQDAYYRIRIREGEEWKTAFRTRYGHFEYTVMPFGLTNAPATFQNYIHTALRGLLDVVCVAYLDDILIFSPDRETHTDHICQVLQRLRDAQLYAKPAKCTFFQDQVEFLGFVISRAGISMDKQRVEAIASWEIPKSYHEIQVFLGFCNFYRRFIRAYSLIALPLTSLLRGSKNGKKPGSVILSDNETQAFHRLLDAFQEAPVLQHFDPQKNIRIEPDASNLGMAGILSQPDDDGKWHPVAFWSKKFSGAELHYSTPDQELFAIVYSFKQWRHYLEGSKYPVEVLSDHANLQTFMKQPKLNGRQARWLMFLTPFEFVIKHRSGKTNPADGLSRKPNASQVAPAAELTTPIQERFASDQGAILQHVAAQENDEVESGTPELTEKERDSRRASLHRRVPIRRRAFVERDSRRASLHHRVPVRRRAFVKGENRRRASLYHRVPLHCLVYRRRASRDKVVSHCCIGLIFEEDAMTVRTAGGDRAITQREVERACVVEQVYSLDATTELKALVGRIQGEDPEARRRIVGVSQAKRGTTGWSVQELNSTADLKTQIGQIQGEDPETRRRIADLPTEMRGSQKWLVDQEGLLRYQGRLYIPERNGLRQKLLNIYHDDPLAGHFGRTRTTELLRRKFHWINMQNDVAQYVKECAVCQGTATPRHRPYGKLESLPIPQRPFSDLSMDFITHLPQAIYKDCIVDAILVIVDRFSKYAVFLPVSATIDAVQLAELFHQEIELRFGPPNSIVSDRGSIFTSKFWSKLCYQSHVKLRFSTAFHPQTDGQTERMNQVLESYLRCFINEEQTNWPILLPTAQFATNNAINSTTGLSPFKALYGYDPNFHLRAEDGTPGGEVPATTARLQKLQELREKLQEGWRKASESQAKHYNKRHVPKEFRKKQLVALSTRNLRLKSPSRKLAPNFIGPFRVLDKVGKQAYRLALPEKYSRLHNVFPVSLLQEWHQRNDSETLPMPELEDDDEWEVEEVRGEKKFQNELHYLVKWKGWPSEYNQWVPLSDMGNAKGIITKFQKQKKRSN
jgi:transposase InsO family protein